MMHKKRAQSAQNSTVISTDNTGRKTDALPIRVIRIRGSIDLGGFGWALARTELQEFFDRILDLLPRLGGVGGRIDRQTHREGAAQVRPVAGGLDFTAMLADDAMAD